MNWINGIKLKIIWLCEYILSFIVFVISIFKKMKKPVITGMLAAGLLVAPGNKADAVPFYFARAPPTYADEYLKKEYPYEWFFTTKGYKESTIGGSGRARQYIESAIKLLEKRYEKEKNENKKVEILYLLAYNKYILASRYPSFEETEDKALEALELIEKRLKEQPNDFDFIDLKQIIYYNLADTYYRAYKGDQKYEEEIEPSKKDFYKKKAIKYCNKWLEYYEDIKGRWDQLQPYSFNLSEEDKKLYVKECEEEYQKHLKDIKRIQAELQNENNK